LLLEAIGQVQRNVLAGKDLIGRATLTAAQDIPGNGNIRNCYTCPTVTVARVDSMFPKI